MVRCADGTFYTGISVDVKRRVGEHNGSGTRGARYTRARRPVRLVYLELADSRATAARREYAIKQLRRSAKMALAKHWRAANRTLLKRIAGTPAILNAYRAAPQRSHGSSGT